MGMFEMNADQVAEWRQKCLDLVAERVDGEEVKAAAGFRQGGAAASYAASKAQMGGLVYAGIKMLRKKQAGGLPDKVMLAVTPNKIHAFKLRVGREYKLGDEVATWDRAGVKVSAEQRSGMTALTIESPTADEKATLVGIGVKDDPVSLDLIDVLQGSAPAAA